MSKIKKQTKAEMPDNQEILQPKNDIVFKELFTRGKEEITKAHTKWQIREEENSTIVLTSYFEFHIIEVPKAIKEYTKNPQDAVLQWMMFLNNPNKEEVTKIMEKNKNIKEAKEKLNQLSRDEALRRIALKEELLRMDIKQAKEDAKKYGREEGLEEGRREGKREGKEEGIKEGKVEIAQRLFEINMPIEQIAKIVDLDVIEIKKILE